MTPNVAPPAATPRSEHVAALLRALPDEPRWLEAHGIAADPAGWTRSLGAGAALGHDGAGLIVLVGDVAAAEAAALADAHPAHAILCAIEAEAVAEALACAARPVGRALLHTLRDPAALPALEGATRLPPDLVLPAPGEPRPPLAAELPAALAAELPAAPVVELPAALAAELAAARAHGDVWASWLDDAPVSFAYAPWRTARWFEVAVETLPAARQLGLGAITAAALIEAERAAGREPVWGADEDNVASRRLAAALGFVAVDALWIAAPAARP